MRRLGAPLPEDDSRKQIRRYLWFTGLMYLKCILWRRRSSGRLGWDKTGITRYQPVYFICDSSFVDCLILTLYALFSHSSSRTRLHQWRYRPRVPFDHASQSGELCWRKVDGTRQREHPMFCSVPYNFYVFAVNRSYRSRPRTPYWAHPTRVHLRYPFGAASPSGRVALVAFLEKND